MTSGDNVYTTPPLTYDPNRRDVVKTKSGKKKKLKATTYTYFCRIHPLMRGSIRVAQVDRCAAPREFAVGSAER